MELPYEHYKDIDFEDLMNIYSVLEETKFRVNNHRNKSSGRGYTASLGFVVKRPQKKGDVPEVITSQFTLKNPELMDILNKFANKYLIPYTTIQVNKNYCTLPHRDSANVNDEPSYLFSLGDYEGGALMIQDDTGYIHKVHARDRLFSFNGAKYEHYNLQHEGIKYTIVFYRNKRVASLQKEQSKKLMDFLGFKIKNI